jgi:hypothetical protein
MSSDERAVLGDELQQRGDPQGELIALQLALEALPADAPRARRSLIERRIATCLDQHHDAFYGALAPHVHQLSRPDVRDPALAVKRWSAGFADELWLQACHAVGLPEIVRVARELPIARLVRRIELGVGDQPSALAELSRAPWSHLRELLVMGRWHASRTIDHVDVHDLDGAGPLLAQLEALDLQHAITYTPFESPALRRLWLTHDYRQTPMTVFDARLPALEELHHAGFQPDPTILERFPRLRRLTFTAEPMGPWLSALLASPHIARMTHLTLGYRVADAELDILVQHADRIAHMELVELTHDWYSAEVLARVQPRLPPCVKLRGG